MTWGNAAIDDVGVIYGVSTVASLFAMNPSTGATLWSYDLPGAGGTDGPTILDDGTDFAVRIEWCEGGQFVYDYSDAAFEITGSVPPPTLTLTGPNGGEV